MGYRDIRPGEKKGRPTAARFIKSKNGTLGLEVNFSFHEGSVLRDEHLTWVAWLSEKAIENSMATLVDVLGYNGNDECNLEGVLTHPNALNWNQEVKLVVELQAFEGKEYPKIKWVNKLSGTSFSNCEPNAIKADLDKLGFKAAFLSVKNSKNIPF